MEPPIFVIESVSQLLSIQPGLIYVEDWNLVLRQRYCLSLSLYERTRECGPEKRRVATHQLFVDVKWSVIGPDVDSDNVCIEMAGKRLVLICWRKHR